MNGFRFCVLGLCLFFGLGQWALPASAAGDPPEENEQRADRAQPDTPSEFEFIFYQPRYYPAKAILPDLVRDQQAIWLSPFRFEWNEASLVLPISLTASALIPADPGTSSNLSEVDFPSKSISALGGPTNFLTSGAIYGIGRIARRPKLQETGLLSLRATANTWFVVHALKKTTNRERPDKDGGGGRFWGGGTSFPSGHSASTWAMATVVAEQYSKKPWLRVGAYGLASAVSFSRLSGKRHYLSDVVVGGIMGHLIGRYVVKDWKNRQEFMRSKAYQQAQQQP